MIYIAYSILAFAGLQFIIAFLNYLFRTNYSRYRTVNDQLVSILIPARNEAKNIENILKDLSQQNYHNIEIIVIDDDSSDTTRDIVMKQSLADKRITLMEAGWTADSSWLGKNYACHQGAMRAKGKYLLFLDADVRIGKDAIASVIGYLEYSRSVFLSVFPKQLMTNKGVKSVVPIMNYILLSLLPLFSVRHAKFSSMAAANGQLMLFDRDVYLAFYPHKKFKHEKVEDIHIARFLKKKKFNIACLTGNDDISCNMYDSYEEAMEGFSKNSVAFFGNSYIAATLFWFISLTGILWIALLLPIWWVLAYLIMVIGTRIFISITSQQSIADNILLHFEQIYNLGRLLLKSFQHKINKNYQWKGRNIA